MAASPISSADPLLPFHLYYTCQDFTPSAWHAQTRLYFILSGSVQVIAGGQTFDAGSEDIFLINAGDPCLLAGTSWEAAVITFRQDQILQAPTVQTVRFDVSSAGSTYASRFDYIRYCFARLAEMHGKDDLICSSLSIFYALYSHLLQHFSVSAAGSADSQGRERLSAIIRYINSHYREDLTLNETAAAFSLSVPYFAAFFKKQTGRTFMEYYNEIRLNYAVRDLLGTRGSIETIALQNGFRDSRSFTALFRRAYHVLPNAYRRSHRSLQAADKAPGAEAARMSAEPSAGSFDETPGAETARMAGVPHAGSVSDETPGAETARIAAEPYAGSASSEFGEFPSVAPDFFPSLSKYTEVFREEPDFLDALSRNPRIIDAGTVSILGESRHLTHNYHTMICVGSAKQFLYREVQDMLIRAQKELRFRYVKFHGLLSDDMMVYSEDAGGTPHYSFTFVDKAFDFLLSIGLRPLCQLSFMPIALAEDPARLMDFYHYNTSPPKDLRKWTGLVDALVRHLISRYGTEEVRQWLFCVWNEPDETVEQFAWDDRQRFFRFYEETWKTVKAVCPDLLFGTPSLLLSVQKEAGWAGEFFAYAASRGCAPDFLNLHYYDNSLFAEDSSNRIRGEKGLSTENMEHSFPLTADPHAFTKFIDNVQALLRKHNMRSIPIYLTEWNLTISHRDLINDTCFKSCHLVKNLLENYDRLKSFSYWSLTDFIEELQLPSDLYHGGLGLFTYNGIPKANYNAFLLLGRLGDELLRQGDGYFITRTGSSIRILLYNYEHYSRLFGAGHRTEQHSQDRYSPFEEMSTAQFAVRLSDLAPWSRALIREHYVNQYAGSSYDTWVRMGSQPLDRPEEYDLLMQESHPGLFLHREIIEDGTLSLHIRMAPLEVRLLEIELA